LLQTFKGIVLCQYIQVKPHLRNFQQTPHSAFTLFTVPNAVIPNAFHLNLIVTT